MPNDQALPNKVGQRKVSEKIGAKNCVGYLQWGSAILKCSDSMLKGSVSTYLNKNEKAIIEAYVVTLDSKNWSLSSINEKCYRFKSFNPCQHVLPVASILKLLKLFLGHWNK